MIAAPPAPVLNLPPENIVDLRQDTVYDIPVNVIYADADFNVRGEIDPISVAELANDIKEKGLIQPITVQPWRGHIEGCRYRILAGHRRHMAHLVAGLKHIRCLVKVGLSDLESIVLNLNENLHRKQLNMFQEAQSIKKLKMMGFTEHETAKHIGMSRGWVQVRYMILALPHVIQEEIAKGTLNSEQIRQCYSEPLEEDQIEYVRRVKDAKLLGKKRPVKPVNKKSTAKVRSQQEIFDLQDVLRDLFGNGIETMLLGWAAGVTHDYYMQKQIYETAKERGKYYQIPNAYKVKPVENV